MIQLSNKQLVMARRANKSYERTTNKIPKQNITICQSLYEEIYLVSFEHPTMYTAYVTIHKWELYCHKYLFITAGTVKRYMAIYFLYFQH